MDSENDDEKAVNRKESMYRRTVTGRYNDLSPCTHVTSINPTASSCSSPHPTDSFFARLLYAYVIYITMILVLGPGLDADGLSLVV